MQFLGKTLEELFDYSLFDYFVDGELLQRGGHFLRELAPLTR